VAAVPPMGVMNSRRLIAFPSRTSKNFDGTPRSVVRENSSGFRRLTLRDLNPFKCGPLTSEEEPALRVARPNVGICLDKLRPSGHVVFVRQFQLGAKPKAGVLTY
jgi:hypothetical protein